MAKTKISEWSTTPSSNSDIDGINIAEGCAPSGINDAIRDMMAQIRSWQSGATGDPFAGPVTGAVNATVGATTPNTGAFTTLSASSTVTLSGGTANGVTYLNGSKVLTSGSALTFDGTNTFKVIPSTGAAYSRTESSQYSTWMQMGAGNANVFWEFSANTPVRWVDTSSGELMRLTSTGLGIGTSSPTSGSKLDVNGQIVAQGGSSSSLGFAFRSATTTGIYVNDDGVGANLVLQANGSSNYAYLSRSGNLGLGVTPSAWRSTIKATQIGQSGSVYSNTNANAVVVASNDYVDSAGADRYIATGYSTLYQQVNGQHQFYNAPSGTAGNAISFTQAMTLDASGNLGVGTTSPSGTLHVKADNASARVEGNNSTNSTQFIVKNTTSNFYVALDSNSGGSFGKANAAVLWLDSANPMVFATNNSERARIDSSGNLLVGKTDSTNSTSGVQIYNSSGSTVGRINCIKTASGTASALANYYSGTYVGGIDYSNTATSLVASSDERLKENIVEAPQALNKITSIEVVSYDWKHDPTHVEYGFVAQRLNTVYPEAVIVGDNNEEIEKTWGVEYGRLTPMLVKAIQEQQAIIESLKARLDAANL